MLSTSAAAPVPDTIAQRVVACAACHGDAGRATRDGFFPRIAGKPAGYLYNQLINFREGRRRNPQMIYMVDHLSDAYLHEIADYFSNLHPPYALPQPILANTAALERGKQLALLGDQSKRVPACIACHGEKLTGTLPTIPGLLGLPRDYLNAQFGAWRTKTRRAAAPDCMAQIVSRLSDQDLSAAANWLAAQPIPVQPVAAPASSIVAKLPLTCGSFPQ
ncbi:MAG: cytochrome c4 [Herbaspirillum sp.]